MCSGLFFLNHVVTAVLILQVVSNEQNVLEGLLPKIAMIKPLCKISNDPCLPIVELLCSRVKAAVASKLKVQRFCDLGSGTEERLRKDPKRQLLMQSVEAHSNFLRQDAAVVALCHDLEAKLESLTAMEKSYFELNHKVVASGIDTTDLSDGVKMLMTECVRRLNTSHELVVSILGDLLTSSWHSKIPDDNDFQALSETANETIGKIKAKPLNTSLDALEKELRDFQSAFLDIFVKVLPLFDCDVHES